MDNDLMLVVVNGQQVSDAIPASEAYQLADQMADDLTERGEAVYIELINVSMAKRDWAREVSYLN